MNILFIHGNYPGQFKYLASGLGLAKEHNVVSLQQGKKVSVQILRVWNT